MSAVRFLPDTVCKTEAPQSRLTSR